MALTEVYSAKYVPPVAPDFVDSLITEEDNLYLFEIYPDHPDVIKIRESGGIIQDFLERHCNFKGVQFIYSGERPNFSDSHSCDLVPKTSRAKRKKRSFWQL